MDKSTILTSGPKSPDMPGSNVFYTLMMAISESSKGVSLQQIADAESAMNFGHIENDINQLWYKTGGILDQITQNILNCANNSDSNGVQYWQSVFNKNSAVAQQAGSSADSILQMANQQSSADSTNIQNINQLGSSMNIMGYIANLLAK